jgi:RNA polymerase sigma factor (sigma-70 family)
MENGTIVQQLRAGHNEAALRELYKAFPAVSHFIRKNGGNQEDARDMFQESLLIFYRNVQQKDFTLTSSLNTYLFSIVKYLWKDELKKKNRTVPFELHAQDMIPNIAASGQEELKISLMGKVLGQLGEKCSEILRLFYYEKKAMEEIAALLQYKNVDTAKTQKYKCMERAKAMAGEMMLSSLTEDL